MERLIPEYLGAMEKELLLWKMFMREHSSQSSFHDEFQVETVYFGGGTPSLLQPAQIAYVIERCRAFPFAVTPEITLEANPGTVQGKFFARIRRSGVNRLSLGAQSFNDGCLKLLGRIHSADEVREAFLCARKAGFDNINMDLIYALPGQTMLCWQNTLEEALRLHPEHLSLYSLTLEEGTPLAGTVKAGLLPLPDEDLAADMYLLAEEVLSREGYIHYEISNWAVSGKECRHNLAYWKNTSYLGVGAGAHSFLFGHRFAVVSSPQEYVEKLSALEHLPLSFLEMGGKSHLDFVEGANVEREMSDTVIMGLRLQEGIDPASFARRFQRDLLPAYRQEIGELVELGLLDADEKGIRLSDRGKLLGNEVFMRFLPPHSTGSVLS
jgi:oxygen-independent coproporphyrinogen-3 oxidase